MSLPELIAKLTDIAAQKPTATVHCEESNTYGWLIKSVTYDPENNAAVVNITDDEDDL